MERAFIIGNGKSRIGFDLNQLRGKGTIYGCNALYRDFMPDVLIATDDRMREEIELSEINPDVQKNIPKEIPFYTRRPSEKIKCHPDRPWQTEDYQNNWSRKIDTNWGYSSGPVALTLACQAKHSYLYLVGHDFISDDSKVNNIYADTKNYKTSNMPATFHGNWTDQIRKIMLEFNTCNFARVGALNNYTPENWKECPNHREITFEQFLNEINNV